MEARKIKSERVAEEKDREDDIIHKVLFTAGAALLMACLKRVTITCLVQQWRAWVFLALNLILLAIFLRSIRSTSDENEECNDDVEIKSEGKKSSGDSACSQQDEERKDCHDIYKKGSGGSEPELVDEEIEEVPIRLMSKEELNERVETFIAMFRQHLASDAKKGRSPFFDKSESPEIFNFQRVSSVTLSPQRSHA